MNTTTPDFVHAGSLEELKAKRRLVVHGRHRPVLLVYEDGHVFALDNRCPHMGFPLERGSVEDGILTCHWHHARFELASGCTFDLWADDVPTCPVEIRAGGEIWVKPLFGYADPVGHWRQRLEDGLAHNLSLVIAKAVEGQLAAGQSSSDLVRQVEKAGSVRWGACADELPTQPLQGRHGRFARVIAAVQTPTEQVRCLAPCRTGLILREAPNAKESSHGDEVITGERGSHTARPGRPNVGLEKGKSVTSVVGSLGDDATAPHRVFGRR